MISEVITNQTGEPRLTLEQRLALFDPHKHSGEEMVVNPVGLEKF